MDNWCFSCFRIFAVFWNPAGHCHQMSLRQLWRSSAANVVERRVQYEASKGVASEIPDMVDWLLQDFSFQPRPHVCRVLKLCVLVTGRPRMDYPAVAFDLSGSMLAVETFKECLQLVQSYVLSPGYAHKSFFTDVTMDAVRESIANAGVFYVAPNFDLWAEFCGGIAEEFVSRYSGLFNSFVLKRRKSYETHYVEINKANCLARAQQVLVATSTAGSETSVAASKTGEKGTVVKLAEKPK